MSMNGPCCGCDKTTENMVVILPEEKTKHLAPDMKFILSERQYYIYLCQKCQTGLGKKTVKEIRQQKRLARAANLAF